MDIEVQMFPPDEALMKALRTHIYKTEIDPEWLPTSVGENLWASDKCVGEHIDSTSDFKTTYGMVLINDANQRLNYRGTIHRIPAGTMYRMDARFTHSTEGNDGMFCFFTWDRPHLNSLEEVREQMLHYLRGMYL